VTRTPDIRRLTADDVPRLAGPVERARAAGEFKASSDADAQFFLKSVALDPRIVTAAFDDAELVGFISSEFKVIVVEPEHRRRGIGRELVERAIDAERERGRPDVLIGVLADDRPGHAFLRATGFGRHSVLWDLNLPEDAEVAAPAWPAKLIARPFDRTHDVRPWIALFNAAFADHATPLQLDESFITAGLDDPDLADADTLLVEDPDGPDGGLVAFCAAAPMRRAGVVQPHGEIWTIGVRPDRQGTGLGRQLLRWGVGYLRGLGVARISLSVNARNDRALGLYESEGFVRAATRERWARPVPRSATAIRGSEPVC
jgi:mycothiol synthase